MHCLFFYPPGVPISTSFSPFFFYVGFLVTHRAHIFLWLFLCKKVFHRVKLVRSAHICCSLLIFVVKIVDP